MQPVKRLARWILREEIQHHVDALVKAQRELEQFLDDHVPTFGFPGSENNGDKTPKTTREPSPVRKSSGCSRGQSRGEYPITQWQATINEVKHEMENQRLEREAEAIETSSRGVGSQD